MPSLWRRTPLWVRLVAVSLALVTCALAVIGVASVTALQRYLVDQVDGRLNSIGDQVRHQVAEGRNPIRINVPPSGGVDLPIPYVVQTRDAQATVIATALGDPAGDQPRLGARDLKRTDPFTAASASGSGRWRVLVIGLPSNQYVVIATPMTDVDRPVRRLVGLEGLVGLAVLGVLAVVGVALVRRSLRPLREIETAADAIAAGDLSRRVPERDPRTEVGRLARAFNVMIGRIQDAFGAQTSSEAAARSSEARALRSEERMRRFVADASHELRTPLTTIRGFAELYRQGASADPAATGRLIRRIEDEAARMGLLVEDLLLLARLDQQRPLAAEPVDLVVLAGDAAHDARAIATDRMISLDVPGDGPVVVVGDESRLRQVIGNLVTNALTHTPAGTPVALRLRREAERAVIEVADSGAGLTPEQTEKVFERFYRADPARSRRSGGTGTGLGLAIVAALVAAHGGTVEVDSTPGAGATFRVILPLAGPSGEESDDSPAIAESPWTEADLDEPPAEARPEPVADPARPRR